MTAIKKFSRLEAKAVWKENDNTNPKSEIVTFGKSSIIISDENAFPLDHWNFNSIIVISKSKENTIFSQGSNKIETLIIEDDEMINAIILVCNLKTQPSWTLIRFRKFFQYIFFFFLLLIFFYFPNFLREIILKVTDPKYEIIYYESALKEFAPINDICKKNLNIKNFEKKINDNFKKEYTIDITVVRTVRDEPLLLPGGKIIIPFNWLKNEKSSLNFNEMIKVAIYSYKERYIFKNFLNDQSLISIFSFIFGLNTSFNLNFENYNWSNFIERRNLDFDIFIKDEEWINFRNICYN